MRKTSVVLGCAIVLAVAAQAGAAAPDPDAGAPRATMTCERADAPGRVRCDVEARVGAGESITWGDVLLVRTPPFAAALRGRIGPLEATSHDPGVWRWALALVARGKGAGDVEARVRLVVCRDATCAPREVPAIGRVVVGE